MVINSKLHTQKRLVSQFPLFYIIALEVLFLSLSVFAHIFCWAGTYLKGRAEQLVIEILYVFCMHR